MNGILMRISGTTLRKIRDFFEWLTGIRPSHEIICQWVNEIGEEYQKDRTVTVGSGIYNYDEQHLRIKGIKHYRLTLLDVITGEIIREMVVKELTKENIKDFLILSLKGKNVLAVVTDGVPQYDDILKAVARELGLKKKILHQLCTFHALKNFSKAVHDAVKDIKKRKFAYPTDYKNLKNTIKLTFSLDNKKAIKKYLERLPEGHQKAFLEIINNKHITRKEKARTIFDYIYRWRPSYHPYISNQILWIHDHWDNLTHFYENSLIPKTNNNIEQHFANTNPRVVKRTFKTPSSLENYLFAMAAYKNNNLSLIT